MEMLLLPLAIIGAASVAIHFAASSFEGAADYLGRNLPPGVKGATLNAIASSLPEVFTTFFFCSFISVTSSGLHRVSPRVREAPCST